jgi:hypothetical protein
MFYSDIKCIKIIISGSNTVQIRGPFEKFVDSPYYSESRLCGGAVTVFFSKYLPWKAMHFLQRSTRFSKTCCRPLITSKFLTPELPFHGWKSPEIAWGEMNWILCSAWKKWIGGTPLEYPSYCPYLAQCAPDCSFEIFKQNFHVELL